MSSAIVRIEGRAIPLGLANVDTDTIIPAAYLKTLTRLGLGEHAFEPLRGNPCNLFDDPNNQDAPILIAGENFGCGSSREHAVWALIDRGIRAVIAPSFSDIFAGNAFKNGLVTVALEQPAIDRMLETVAERPVVVDLEEMRVFSGTESFAFALDPFRRHCLINGLDEIGLTLASDTAIADYEAKALLLDFTFSNLLVEVPRR